MQVTVCERYGVVFTPEEGHEKNKAKSKSPLVVYLACPYSHADEHVREIRFVRASKAAGWLINNGYGVISPISQGHPITVYGGAKGDWQTWEATDLRMIDASDALVVLNIPGLTASVGVKAEVAYAVLRGIPISIMTPLAHQNFTFSVNEDAAFFVATRLGVAIPNAQEVVNA